MQTHTHSLDEFKAVQRCRWLAPSRQRAGNTLVPAASRCQGAGADPIAELYETLPVFLRDPSLHPKAVPTAIEWETAGKWMAATDQWQERVTAVKLSRHGGAVLVRFDAPRRVKLSPADWSDTWFTKATCRNVLIDLLENGDQPLALKEAKRIEYRIEPASK